MSDGALIALIAGGQVLILTVVQSWVLARKERRDYARQDQVAERVDAAAKQAAAAAQLLVKSNEATIVRTDKVAKLAAESGANIQTQLKKIHILVNSDMTAARTSERDQTKLTLVALRQVKALSLKLGLDVSKADEEAIESSQARIAELDQILADRLAAQRAVDQEASAQAATQKGR
jgi:hypothetical protein